MNVVKEIHGKGPYIVASLHHRMCANDFMCFYLNEGFSYYPLLMHIHVVVNQPSSTVLCFLISDRILKTSTTFLQGLWCSLTSFLVEILILTIHTVYCIGQRSPTPGPRAGTGP